jgi:two-component system, cell cycle sensor histidine kinase and response regulator CckA
MSDAKNQGRPETSLEVSNRNELHQVLFEEAPDGIFITDPQSRFVAVNRRGTELTGYAIEELLGMTITDLIPPEDLARDPIPMDDLRQGKVVLKERRFLRKDGSLLAVETSARMLPAGNLLGIVRDITGRKHGEIQLRESEEKFRRLIETTGTGYVIIDDSGRVTDANQEYVHLSGRQELEEVIGHSVLEWTAPHDLERNALEVRKCIEQGPVRHLEIDYVTPSGQLVPVEISATVLSDPGTLRILGLCRDISKRKKAGEELRARENLLSSIFRAVPIGIGVVSNRHLLAVNDRICEMIGCTSEDLVGKSARVLYPSDADFEYVGTEKYRQIAEHGTGTVETRWQCKDGRLIDVLLSSTPINPLDMAGEVTFTALDITERKRAEEELRATNEQLQALVQSSPVAIIVLDPEGHVKLWSPASERVFGWTETEVLDRFLPYVPADKIEEHGVSRARVLGGESFTGIEVRRRRKDGMPVDLSVSTVPLRDAQGRITGIMSMNVDITDRRRAEEALRESKDRFTVFMENLPAGAFMKDVPGQVVYANRYLCDLFGWGNIIGRSTSELLPSEVAEKMAADDRAALAQGPITVTEQVRDVANRERIFQTSKFPIARQGRMPLLGGISVDITELKLAEALLLQSKERLRLALKAANQGLYDLNMKTGEAEVSPEYATMIGYDPAEFHETHAAWLERLHPEDREPVAAIYRDYIAGKITEYQVEFRQRTRSGDWKWILSLGKIVERDDRGEPSRMLGTHTDITERKRAEAEKDALQAQLQQAQKMESVGRLAGGVAHDFNNMLSAILGHAELAMMQCPPSEPLQDDLKAIQRAAQRSADLVRQLLAFARRQTVAPKILDLNDIVSGMLKMLLRLIGEDIDLVWMPGAGLWSIKIDPSQIDQLLANLCVNARDAIAGVGKVTIETENIAFDEAYCAVHPGFACGEYAMLAVSDDGCGMSREVLDHLFEPFFTTKEVGKGTGLGLATVYGIVKQNEGFINVYSEPDKGTTFRIYLPRFVGEVVEPMAESTAEAPKGHGETVLVVEDEAVILNVGRVMLERLGYTVLTATTPGEALRQAIVHASAIKLLITDVVMPQMNGRELAKLIRGIKPGLKCLFTSGYTANVIAHHGVLEEGVYFLQKPFSMKDLASMVREALE